MNAPNLFQDFVAQKCRHLPLSSILHSSPSFLTPWNSITASVHRMSWIMVTYVRETNNAAPVSSPPKEKTTPSATSSKCNARPLHSMTLLLLLFLWVTRSFVSGWSQAVASRSGCDVLRIQGVKPSRARGRTQGNPLCCAALIWRFRAISLFSSSVDLLASYFVCVRYKLRFRAHRSKHITRPSMISTMS